MTLVIKKPTGARLVYKKDSVAAADVNIREVSLLLHGNGTNGSTTITDSSLSPKTVTAVGDAKISTAQSKFGGSSIAFDGVGDYLQSPSNSAFQFGTGNFTIELWAFFNGISNQLLYDTLPIGGGGSRPNGFAWVMQSNGRLDVFSSNTASGSSAGFKGASSTVLTTNRWYHLAICRQGAQWSYFIDGVRDSVQFNFGADLTDSNFLTGRVGDTTSYFVNGYFDEYRVTKGIARYTANFTPPTAPFPDF